MSDGDELPAVPLRDCPDPDRCSRDRQLMCTLVEHLRDRVRNLEQETLVDPLTRVGNRRAFDQDIEAFVAFARRHQSPLALALVDLDHFKRFNDTYGHPAGDVALSSVASALARGRRKSDRLARIGGEEFGLLMPGVIAGAAVSIGERLRSAVARLDISITISVGVATLQPTEGMSDLLRAADRALYDAKHSGRDRVVALVR